MKDKILDIIKNHPNHYTKIIKKDQQLVSWVNNNSLICSDIFIAHLRSAVYQETNVCSFGNVKKISRFNSGFIGCGPANICRCVAESISNNVSKTKHTVSAEEKIKTNVKRANTMLKKYGVAHNLQREDVKKTLSSPKIKIPTHNLLIDRDWLENEYVIKQRSLVDIANELEVYYSTVGDYCRRHGFEIRQRSLYSLVELEVGSFITSLGIEIIANDRVLLNGKEIDIFIPSKNLGIEINGLYWHSYNPASSLAENRTQHLIKSNLANQAGIQLLHFTDSQWITKKPIVKSIISSKLGLTSKIYARKCQVKEIDTKTAKEFFNQTHLDGFSAASSYIGLEYLGEIIQCISVGKKRFGDKQGIEVVRFSTKLNHTVVGGLSKLISYIKTQCTGPIVTFCSRDISTAAAYQTVGFTLVRETGPGYFWTDGTNIISRQKSQRNSLKKWMSGYDPNKSQAENMFSAGYRRYWNSGNYYLELK
jgi:uncharacterized protein YehS (DUF1456 family)